jgi:4-aminobutyrate aminotransferase
MPPASGLDSFLFVTTGAEAVEAAVKLARHATGKPNIIVFQGSYHGRTLLTGAMTTSKNIFRGRYGPAPAGIFVAPFPSTDFGDLSVETCLEQLELMFATQTAANETAAVVIEPVLGEGGYRPCPPEFLQGIANICQKHGVLFIADEVQTGFGRTGKMFAIERSGAKPDVLVFAKGIASGIPIAGIASRKELTDAQPAGAQGGTYAGNAIACAAANATIGVLSKDGFMDDVNARGEQLRAGLHEMKHLLPVKDIRGHGLMIGIEFDKDVVPKGFAGKISKACLSRGMIILSTGVFETIRMIPPLNVSASECDESLKIMKAAFEEVAAELK